MTETDDIIDAPSIHVEDGYLVDQDGEIIGIACQDERFRPQTTDEVEWVLSRMAEEQSKLAARKARTAAVLANLKALEREHERRLAYLEARFRPDLIEFARKAIEGKKGKTLQLENGRISFRTTAGTNEIVDMDAAVRIVEGYSPALVKREVTVSKLLEAAEAAKERWGWMPELKGILNSTGPRESVIIDTGIREK